MKVYRCKCNSLGVSALVDVQPCMFCYSCGTSLEIAAGVYNHTPTPHSIEVKNFNGIEIHQCRWCRENIERIKDSKELFSYEVR